MFYKFQKGDKVLLKKDLEDKKTYFGAYYYDEVAAWQGIEMTIQKGYVKEGYNHYIVDENNYSWGEFFLVYISSSRCDRRKVYKRSLVGRRYKRTDKRSRKTTQKKQIT
jgi:hypothetical protein